MKEITDQDRKTKDHMAQIDPRHTVEMGEPETAALREWLKRREKKRKIQDSTGQGAEGARQDKRRAQEVRGLGKQS